MGRKPHPPTPQGRNVPSRPLGLRGPPPRNPLKGRMPRIWNCCPVTLRLRIAPDEYAALFRFAGEAHPTIRSRFRFRFAGGSSLFTLRAVEAYDPREGVAHCTFDRLCDD